MQTKLSFLAALMLLAQASCRKEEKEQPPVVPSYASAGDNALAEDAFSDMLQAVDDAAEANGLRDAQDGCTPTVSIDTLAFPHTITVDFGPVNCTASSGRQRRGMLHVTFTGWYNAQGTVITIVPEDYYVNDHHVQGTKTVTNLGPDSDGHPRFGVEVNGSITAPDGSWTATHQATRVRTWVVGHDTANPMDDVYLISGNGSGVDRNGTAYTLSIAQPLRVAVGCAWITAGTIQLTPSGHPTIAADWGSGACDNSVTISVNGYTFTILIN